MVLRWSPLKEHAIMEMMLLSVSAWFFRAKDALKFRCTEAVKAADIVMVLLPGEIQVISTKTKSNLTSKRNALAFAHGFLFTLKY